MLRQKASLSSEVVFTENRCSLNNVLFVPPAVSHFTAGWTEEQRNPSPMEAGSQLALRSHSLILIIVCPSICNEIDMPLDVVKGSNITLVPTSQWGPVFAQLALHSVHTRTNLIWPEGGSCDWWFHHVSSATAIWPGSTAVRMLVCGCACVNSCLNVTMNKNVMPLWVWIFRAKRLWMGSYMQVQKNPHWPSHMRSCSSSSCSLVVCAPTFPKQVTSCEPTLSRLC